MQGLLPSIRSRLRTHHLQTVSEALDPERAVEADLFVRPSAATGPPAPTRLSISEYNELRSKGLCFRFRQPYSHNHECSVKEFHTIIDDIDPELLILWDYRQHGEKSYSDDRTTSASLPDPPKGKVESSTDVGSSRPLHILRKGDFLRENFGIVVVFCEAATMAIKTLIETETNEVIVEPPDKPPDESLLSWELVSVRDIRQSAIDSSFSSLQHQNRLLRFILTDGLSETVAIEYTAIPGIMEEIIPGCKVVEVRLEKKIVIHYGILCLDAGTITIMGGLVQSLYDEWHINRRYSGFSRSLMTKSRNDDGDGPPPFEKLQTDAFPREASAFSSSHEPMIYTRLFTLSFFRYCDARPEARSTPVDVKPVSSTTKPEEKTSSSAVSRPKEVIEAVPVQNQAAAQKLLQKMSQPMPQGRNPRDHRTRFKGRQEEAPIFTLDEWERKKAGTSSAIRADIQDTSADEILARELQSQLDFEDHQNHTGNLGSEAERIRMSMFSFGGAEERGVESRDDFRGRGRGRGRGRKRF
ncbi:hypothetical protein KSP39_PZI023677 [Platanthera zijinensis]|uniref:RecQ mediated genome instability protein 1 OB-fold domain-containing protein n=1 Tax=Platanthera zijinensis TaxID=2320716 RepID=A0AAP0AT39_9ASPA